MYSTSKLDELFRILISIKGFKLRQPQWSNTTEVLEVSKNREVRRGLKERFLELHEKAQKWEILAYHLKVICAENPEVEPLPDLENDAYQ